MSTWEVIVGIAAFIIFFSLITYVVKRVCGVFLCCIFCCCAEEEDPPTTVVVKETPRPAPAPEVYVVGVVKEERIVYSTNE